MIRHITRQKVIFLFSYTWNIKYNVDEGSSYIFDAKKCFTLKMNEQSLIPETWPTTRGAPGCHPGGTRVVSKKLRWNLENWRYFIQIGFKIFSKFFWHSLTSAEVSPKVWGYSMKPILKSNYISFWKRSVL